MHAPSTYLFSQAIAVRRHQRTRAVGLPRRSRRRRGAGLGPRLGRGYGGQQAGVGGEEGGVQAAAVVLQ